jgi:hypothetical protein
MAVITSDLLLLCSIRLIGSSVCCMQSKCRNFGAGTDYDLRGSKVP